MTEAGSQVQQLLVTIRQGMAPRTVRLFAAQGLLPVSREELIRVLVLLAADGDEEISGTAAATLTEFSLDNFLAVLADPELESIEVDLLARERSEDAVHQVVAQHPKVANETLRWLARTGSGAIQNIIITNQTRVMACLELIEDLRANPNVTQDVLRRAREFEEEFLQKAIVWASADEITADAPVSPSIENVLAELRAIGMRIPGDTGPAPAFVAEIEPDAPPEIKDAFVRLALMNTFQRVMRALKGTREERLILVRDRSPMIIRAVMNSPMLNEREVEQIAAMRGASDEVFRIIASKPRWTKRYGVLRNLCFNPKVPPGVVLQIFRRLALRDMALLVRDRNVSELVRRVARQELEHRR